MRRGIAGELPDEHALLETIRVLRERGYTRLDAFSPYLVHHLDDALGRRRSSISVVTGIGALCGAVGAYALQWYLVAYLYPIDLGGRPPHMPLPYLIITIEMGFLFGALATFVGFLIASRLFKLWDPVNEIQGFESATRDRFWVAIDADDEKFDRQGLESLLREAGAARVSTFGGIL